MTLRAALSDGGFPYDANSQQSQMVAGKSVAHAGVDARHWTCPLRLKLKARMHEKDLDWHIARES
jgi:hypothetical protein